MSSTFTSALLLNSTNGCPALFTALLFQSMIGYITLLFFSYCATAIKNIIINSIN